MTTAPVRARGTWRTLAGGWRGIVPAVVGNAVVQGVLTIGDPQIRVDPSFVVRVLVSALVLIVATAVVTVSAAGPGRGASFAKIIAWTTGVGVIVAAGAVVSPWAGPPLLLLGAFVLPAVSAGARRPIAAGFGSVRHAPIRYVLALVAYVVLAALSWVAALLLGFFVTGPIAAGLTWLWLGSVAAVVLCWWTSLLHRGDAEK